MGKKVIHKIEPIPEHLVEDYVIACLKRGLGIPMHVLSKEGQIKALEVLCKQHLKGSQKK